MEPPKKDNIEDNEDLFGDDGDIKQMLVEIQEEKKVLENIPGSDERDIEKKHKHGVHHHHLSLIHI